jgi:hypothetical protein
MAIIERQKSIRRTIISKRVRITTSYKIPKELYTLLIIIQSIYLGVKRNYSPSRVKKATPKVRDAPPLFICTIISSAYICSSDFVPFSLSDLCALCGEKFFVLWEDKE